MNPRPESCLTASCCRSRRRAPRPAFAGRLNSAGAGRPPRRPGRDFPLPPRGAGYTVLSYLIAGIVVYGGIGWLVGRAVHSAALFPIGMLIGLVISIGLVIHRYGRS